MTKVLVIEDDSFLVDAYSTKLKKAGYKLTLATNGEEGLSQAAQVKPDIILLDLLLPKRNGFDVLGELKATSKLKKIPVVVLSNLGQEKDIEQVRQLGAADYLIKANVTMKTIIETIEEVISKGGRLAKKGNEKSEITIKEVKHHKHSKHHGKAGHKKHQDDEADEDDNNGTHKKKHHQSASKKHDKKKHDKKKHDKQKHHKAKSSFGHHEESSFGPDIDMGDGLDFIEKYKDDDKGKTSKTKKHHNKKHHTSKTLDKKVKKSKKDIKSAKLDKEPQAKVGLKDKLKRGFFKFKKK